MTREIEAVSEVDSPDVSLTSRNTKFSDCEKDDESLLKRRSGRPKVSKN